jgi:methylphosphotriester-DNA--protein-cysteine methyltransferase
LWSSALVETNITFDGVSEVPGADVFLSDGTVQRLHKAQLEEPLFHSIGENATASAGQLLTGFFEQTGTGPKDYVDRAAMKEAVERGVAVTTATLEVRFGDSGIKFKRGDQLADLERVTFDLQLTVTPHKSA